MKKFNLLLYSVVLWTLIVCGNARRLSRSLDVEGAGGNLTQKHHEEVIQSDGLQHFTVAPKTHPQVVAKQETKDTTPSFIKEVPAIQEDINIQSLKNDDPFDLKFGRKLPSDNEEHKEVSASNANKTIKNFSNDIIPLKFNYTENSEVEKRKGVTSQLPSDVKEGVEKQEVQSITSSTETLKVDQEWKNLEMKKKEKGKKEILDTVTVPNDHNGAGRIEKPFKDNANNIKLKDKIKDSNTEASDDRRSTTIRISSSSSSISLGNHDNNKSPSSISFPLGDTPITSEGAVNQSVISVINNNGVYSDPSQKRVKYSLKRAHDIANDTDGDNSSSNGNLLNEDAANDSLPGLNLESQVSPSTFQTSTTGMEKMAVAEQKTSFPRLKPTESTPTKIDMLKVVIPSSSTIVKPSLAFKQQLVNKLKGLDPSPTMPVNFNGEELDENQEKSNSKSSTKPLRKKPKLDYLSSTSEMLIPPTATAWTLASFKTTAESSSSPRGPIQLYGETSTGTLDLLTRAGSKPTTVTPVSRVKGFVPWSTRLLKSTTSRTPPTADIDGSKSQVSTEVQEQQPSLDEQSKKKLDLLKEPLKLPPTSTTGTEGHSIIRTTTELERNMTETSFNTIPSSVNDIMVKDQSTTRTHSASTTEGVVRSLEQIELQSPINNSDSDANKTPAEKENVIETKLLEESNIKENVEIESPEKIKKDLTSNTKNNTANEVLLSDLSQNVNEIKPGNINDILNYTKSTLSPVEAVDSSKIKIISETSEIDPASSDVMIDGGGEDGKSGEESDENEKTKQTTTPPPPALFEPLETTMTLDLDEDFIESDEVSVPEVIESLNNASTTNRTMNTISPKPTEKVVEAKTTTSIVPVTKENSTGTYVTSFEIVSKDNSTQVVTKAPSEGDKNWYKIETKPVLNGTEEEKSSKTVFIEITTTTTVDTTIEPETATETSMQETTVVPDTSQTAVTVSTTTASTAGTELPESVIPEYGNPEDDDDLSSCVQIRVTCQDPQQLKEYLASQLMNENIAWEQVQVMGRELQDCETKDLTEEDERLEITVCFIDKDEKPSSAIRKEFLRLHSKRISDTIIPVVDLNTAQPPEMESGFDNVLAAIILSVIAAICLILLGILLVIIRKRQGKFNYGQRCTPVSLDDYSLDNISVYNSTRRKGAMRASKRSYGNPAFDDPGGPTHSVNFAGLANFSNDREALDEEFNQLPMITVKPDELPTGAESKNRYANVIPLPETRVLLQVKEGADPLDEYINANYIKGQKGQEKLYIACQAPLQSTIEDFWKMVWQQQTKVILMLTSLNENGVEKCADYLPQLEVTDCHRLFGDFQVTLKKHEVREKYIISNLQVKNLETNLWREVTHLWFSSWPPQGVPDDGSAMIAFLIEARSYMRGAQGPTVVHCSPGTGRTGTVIAIDLCIRDFETQRTVDIPKTVYALRRDRAGAVQTKDQYAFIYQVLNLYATKLTGGALDSI